MQLGPGHRPFAAGVIGHPISHSRSPQLHQAAYAHLAAEGSYTAVDVTPDELDVFIQGFRSDESWRGLSVTMPHKRAVCALIDEIHEPAVSLGAVNTVLAVRSPGGPVRLEGFNTDVQGIVSALGFAGFQGSGEAVVLGGGGTAAAALAAFAALDVEAVTLMVRAPEKAVPLEKVAESLGLELQVRALDHAARTLANATAAVSALPPHAADFLDSGLRQLNPDLSGRMLLDVAYAPWPSAVSGRWENLGGRAVSGLDMLIYQAAEQALLFTNAPRSALPGVINAMCEAVGAPPR